MEGRVASDVLLVQSEPGELVAHNTYSKNLKFKPSKGKIKFIRSIFLFLTSLKLLQHGSHSSKQIGLWL